MADIDNSSFIGDHFTKPTGSDDFAADSQYDRLKRYDSAMGNAGHAGLHVTPPSALIIPLAIHVPVPASSTVSSVRYKAPFPMKIWAVEVGCEAAAGATGTVDVFTDDATTDASILSAARDVKTTAGTSVRAKPTTTSVHELSEGDELYIKGSSGAGGTLSGAQALIYAERL